MLKNVLSKKEKLILSILSLIWLLSMVAFGAWWFLPAHIGNYFGFDLTTIVLAWQMAVPVYCFFFLLKMKKPSFRKVPSNLRVAMITTKVPSEPLSLVQGTLLKMKAQTYAHDTWVADEDPTPEACLWYKKHGIFLSTRKNDPTYHNESWPRRRKCKEGNLAYFYDNYGYEKYDVVVQLDADHAPEPGYLEHMIAPFRKRKIGYVAAPSICDTNYATSWSSRARAQAEAMFHGPIQSGTNAGWSPICIGSHYAVRTKALKQIGGIGPELAEDYSTTLLLNAAGWRGVWSMDAVAHGEGPNAFPDLVIQDYQWARSMMLVFLNHFGSQFKKLSPKKKIQFTFTQIWYPISAFLWAFSVLLAPIALITKTTPVKAAFLEFAILGLLPNLIAILIFAYVRHKKYLRPQNVKLLSWENALFELARWPWNLIAMFDAIYCFVSKKQASFKVTPKQKTEVCSFPFQIFYPYIAIIAINLLAILDWHGGTALVGYVYFAGTTILAYTVLMVVAYLLHFSEAKAISFTETNCVVNLQ